jgi:hypothetical protein
MAVGRASADYLIWYWDGTRHHPRLMAYMSHPHDKIILNDTEYEITDIHWTPTAAPVCVQTVKRLDWAPSWANTKGMWQQR